MIPLQEIDVHTDKKVFYKVHLVAPTGSAPFSSEVLVYDSEFNPPFAPVVSFHQQFNDAKAAFDQALTWVLGHSKTHQYSVRGINNPCNCEFLSQAAQQAVVEDKGISLVVQVNGV